MDGGMRHRNAMAGHSAPEGFRDYAHRELAAATPWQEGICFLPQCGQPFAPSRSWQIYCCKACEAKGTQELRKWGHRLAMPALVHRMTKYEARDPGLRALNNAARRHFGTVQSAWLEDRRARAKERGR